MKKYNWAYRLLLVSSIAVTTAACTDEVMDGINEDKNHPSDVQAKFILSDVITSTAFLTVGGDYSLYASFYMEHETGIYNQFYNAEVRSGEPYIATTYNNAWTNMYTNIKNAKSAVKKLENDPAEKGNDVTLGIAKTMLAYNGAIATDMFGDIPYSQAGETKEDGTPLYMQPKIDTQKEVYESVLSLVDEAIGLFDEGDNGASGAIGANDFIYGGNGALWKKAVYGLKARYMLHLLHRSENSEKDLKTILECVSHSFSSAAEEMSFAVYDGSSQLNPLYGITASRDGMGASASLVQKFVERNDPRVNYSFMQCTNPNRYTFKQITDPVEIITAPNGEPTQTQFKYSYSMPSLSAKAPTLLMSYHELMFIKAEALSRLHRQDEAAEALKEGVLAAFANLEQTIAYAIESNSFSEGEPTVNLDSEVAGEYFDTIVKPLFETSPLKEIMVQKYLSFFGASGESIEAYNDYRRLQAAGENLIELKNPNNAAGKFPLRYPYGSSDVSANLAIKAAYGDGQYVYTEPIWWAGGSR